MSGIAFVFGGWIGPRQPVQNILPQRFERDGHIALDLARAQVEPVESFQDALFHALADFRVELFAQGPSNRAGVARAHSP